MKLSPDKQRDPLGWPFGTLTAKEWAKLKREQPTPAKPVYPDAPF